MCVALSREPNSLELLENIALNSKLQDVLEFLPLYALRNGFKSSYKKEMLSGMRPGRAGDGNESCITILLIKFAKFAIFLTELFWLQLFTAKS